MPEFLLRNERIIHSLKTALACLIGFALSRIVKLHFDQWLIATILVVMCAQLSVGSVVQKSYMRFLGTLAGSLLAVLTIVAFGTQPLFLAVGVVSAGLIFSYIATSQKSYSDAGTLGAVTAAIILVGQTTSVTTAAERFLEISLGILVAAVVSQFIWPFHARTHLRRTQAKTLSQLRDYYLATLLTQKKDESEDYKLLDEVIVKSLIQQRKLAADAAREPLKSRFNLDYFAESLFCEKEVLRCITFMHYAYKSSSQITNLFSTTSAVIQFHEKICETLDALSKFLSQKKITQKIILPLPHTDELKEEIEKAIQHFSENDKINAYTFLFSIDLLLNRLQELMLLINKMNLRSFEMDEHEEP